MFSDAGLTETGEFCRRTAAALRRSIRPRRRGLARQRQGTPDAQGAQRQAAALARDQCVARTLFQPWLARSALHAAWRRQRARGTLVRCLQHSKITPGERADAVFTPADAPGTRAHAELVAARIAATAPSSRGRARPMLEIETVDLPPVAPHRSRSELRNIEPIDLAGATERTINLTIMTASGNKVTMGINGRPFWNSSRSWRTSAKRKSGSSSTTRISASVPSARLFLPRARRHARAGVERHGRRADKVAAARSPSNSTSAPACGCTTATSSITPTSA